MEQLSALHRLTEAVRNAGADIAPTYQEYIQLAFAITTDCGEAGRQDFLTLCSFSPKYDPRAADKLFSNALKNGHNNVHIGTAFHLAEVRHKSPIRNSARMGYTWYTRFALLFCLTHTHT